MYVYNYHRRDRYYTGQEEADISPLDGEVLVPASATLIPPPLEEGYLSFFDEEKQEWFNLKDARGKYFSVKDGSVVEIDYLGEIPEGLTTEAPPSPLHVYVDGEWKLDENLVNHEKATAARMWRNAELFRADIELYKVQDGMGTGSVSEWRAYRCALRNWPDTADFPTTPPKAPDSK